MKHILPLLLIAAPAFADAPVIEAAQVVKAANGWRFDVTLSHPDTGWDHYADGWRVETADGTVIGIRELLHPHVNEQPFTRSLQSVPVPIGTRTVFIRARCNTDGWSDTRFEVTLQD